jgi:hypothetical protein
MALQRDTWKALKQSRIHSTPIRYHHECASSESLPEELPESEPAV